MDAVSKRQIILAAFLALQSWKIYELIVEIQPAGLDLFDNLLTFFFKWASIEIIFIGLVHRFRVPRLTFSLATRGLMFGALLCINLALVIAGPWMGSWYKGLSMMEAVQKERADRQADINSILTSGTVNDIIGSKDALIKGTIILAILPLYIW